MTLEKYIEHLNKIASENPEALKMDLIYATDSEGNGFEPIFYKPSLGLYDPSKKKFIGKSSNPEEHGFEEDSYEVICIN